MTGHTKGKGQLKREATEASIIDAFHRLAEQHGVRGVGVNALVQEAGVGKGLIYKYFGGLSGVVKAWAEKNRLWPDTGELMGLSGEAFSGLSPEDQMKTVIRNHLTALKDNPVALDVLADELMSPAEITDSLSDARKRLGREHQAIFAANHAMRETDNRAIVMLMIAAANYIAMRAARAPRFMGEDLASEDGWQKMLDRFDQVIEFAVGRHPEDATATDRTPATSRASKRSASVSPLTDT